MRVIVVRVKRATPCNSAHPCVSVLPPSRCLGLPGATIWIALIVQPHPGQWFSSSYGWIKCILFISWTFPHRCKYPLSQNQFHLLCKNQASFHVQKNTHSFSDNTLKVPSCTVGFSFCLFRKTAAPTPLPEMSLSSGTHFDNRTMHNDSHYINQLDASFESRFWTKASTKQNTC